MDSSCQKHSTRKHFDTIAIKLHIFVTIYCLNLIYKIDLTMNLTNKMKILRIYVVYFFFNFDKIIHWQLAIASHWLLEKSNSASTKN